MEKLKAILITELDAYYLQSQEEKSRLQMDGINNLGAIGKELREIQKFELQQSKQGYSHLTEEEMKQKILEQLALEYEIKPRKKK